MTLYLLDVINGEAILPGSLPLFSPRRVRGNLPVLTATCKANLPVPVHINGVFKVSIVLFTTCR